MRRHSAAMRVVKELSREERYELLWLVVIPSEAVEAAEERSERGIASDQKITSYPSGRGDNTSDQKSLSVKGRPAEKDEVKRSQVSEAHRWCFGSKDHKHRNEYLERRAA